MKAKDYAQRFLIDPSATKLANIATDFLIEVVTLSQQRHAKTDAAMMSILNEQDQKWQAFARLTNLNPNGFRVIMELEMPQIYTSWMQLRANNGRAPQPVYRSGIPDQYDIDKAWLRLMLGGK